MELIKGNHIEKRSINEASETNETNGFENKSDDSMGCERITDALDGEKYILSCNNGKELNDERRYIGEENIGIVKAMNVLSERVDHLEKLFNAKILHSSYEEKIVDQMHTELQKYKEDMYAQLVRPILMDIIEVRDSMMRMSKTFCERPEEEQVVPLKTFSDYAFDVQDILEKNNITIYKSNEGDSFTPIKQRVIKKVNTPVEELHGKIAESLSEGYEYMGKTLSPERIAIYVCDENENKEGEAN